MNNKKNNSTGGIVVLGFILFFILRGCIHSNSQNNDIETTMTQPTIEATPSPAPTLTPEEQANKDYQEWVDNLFSPWDGSNSDLKNLVKENMNDPDSFKHVETKYHDEGVGIGVTLYMKFRGKNAFGGVITNTAIAFLDYKNQTITLKSIE